MYSVVRHGRRIYACKDVIRQAGTCTAPVIPADVAEERVLEWLTLFVGDVGEWIEGQLAERTDEQAQLERTLDAERAKLAALDVKREQRMAELERVGITALGLEVVERIDRERAGCLQTIGDAEARLAEWTAPTSDGVLAYYERLVEYVRGKVASADGVAAINAALHDSLLGVWLRLEREEASDHGCGDAQNPAVAGPLTLHADIRLRPTGDDDLDAVAAELFGTLGPEPEMLAEQLPRHAARSRWSRGRYARAGAG